MAETSGQSSASITSAKIAQLEPEKQDYTVAWGELTESDKVVTEKIELVNRALNEIGFTWYHVKAFLIAGNGYFADSLLGMAQSTVAIYVNYQYNLTYPTGTEVLYASLLIGCVFWGLSADVIGRKLAFNTSLFACAILSFLVGGTSSFPMYCIFLALSSFMLGGNLAIDASVYLEVLPQKYTWLVTAFACTWSVGQCFGYLMAFAFLSQEKYICDGPEYCPFSENRGWRYVWYTDAAIVLFFAIVRLLFKLGESPKYLATMDKDEEAFAFLERLSVKYNRPISVTLQDFKDCGLVNRSAFEKDPSIMTFLKDSYENSKCLFATRKMTYNTLLLFLSWFLIGLAYPLYGQFLPMYLQAKGANTDAGTSEGVYRDALIATSMSFFGPIIGGALCNVPRIGRKGTMFIGGVTTMAFLMAFTTVRSRSQNLAFNTVSSITFYIYYGCLYAYTPEVLPSYCRTTGSGLAFVCNRIAGLIVPVIAYYADTTTLVPIYVTAACVGALGFISLLFPYEPLKIGSL